MKKTHLILVIWGEATMDMFNRVGAVCMLKAIDSASWSEAEMNRIELHYYLDENLNNTVSNYNNISSINQKISYKTHLINPDFFDNKATSIEIMSDCHAKALQIASDGGAACVFLAPDFLFSSNFFTFIKNNLSQRREVCLMPALRLNRELVLDGFSNELGTLPSISPEKLVSFCMQRKHAFTDALYLNAPYYLNLVPVSFYLPLGKDSLMGAGLHLHPILIVPPQSVNITVGNSIDGDYLSRFHKDLSKVYVVSHSSEFALYEMTPTERWLNEIKPEPLKLGALYHFYRNGCHAIHHHCFQSTFILQAEEEISQHELRQSEELLNHLRGAIKLLMYLSPHFPENHLDTIRRHDIKIKHPYGIRKLFGPQIRMATKLKNMLRAFFRN